VCLEIKNYQNSIEKNYLSKKSILYIGSFEYNNKNIDEFQKKFKLFESSFNEEYILQNIEKYDIIYFIDSEHDNILKEIRKINSCIPIIVYVRDNILKTMKYINYNISYFVSNKTSLTEVMYILQYGLQKHESSKKKFYSYTEQKEYLKILDDFVIISRTDLKGKITYVNDIFCEISGYSKNELIGAHHNIVRHQDMPKLAFKQLWNTIKNGEIWTGIVKNKAKNGETYIAKSTILPYYQDEIKVGYLGLRYVITDEITEKSAIKIHFMKTVIDIKTQLKEKNLENLKYLKEIEQLKKSNNDNYYLAWEQELKKKEKLQKQINYIEETMKEKEIIYRTRIEKYLLEKRENDNVLTKKDNEVNLLSEEKNNLNEMINDFQIDIEDKIDYIEKLQKRNNELKDIIIHQEELIEKNSN